MFFYKIYTVQGSIMSYKKICRFKGDFLEKLINFSLKK